MKPEDAPRLDGWATASKISKVLGISRQTTNLMIRAGEFKTLHLLGDEDTDKPMYLVKASELEKLKGTRVFPRAKGA